ncbi:MAG TPA: hypothetical protein VM581_02415 [Magnetospirillaceae bacterium]|nr:hypothetical protein [Magnetospirillaceae bacterium]
MSNLLPALAVQATSEVDVVAPWWMRLIIAFVMIGLGVYLVLWSSTRVATERTNEAGDDASNRKADTDGNRSNVRFAGFIIGGLGLYIILKTMGFLPNL